jgi:malonyl-CoA decarboxylase
VAALNTGNEEGWRKIALDGPPYGPHCEDVCWTRRQVRGVAAPVCLGGLLPSADTSSVKISFKRGRSALVHTARAGWRRRPWRAAENLRTVLDRRSLEMLRRELRACTEVTDDDVRTQARVAKLASTYAMLDGPGRLAILSMIASDLGTPEHDAIEAARRIVAAGSASVRAEAIHAARAALEARWVKLVMQFKILPDGVKFLVDVRADLLSFVDSSVELRPLEQDLKRLLTDWFDVGLLEMQRVTWDSPASLLEKLARFEAVHEVRGWDDLKNRLDPDRRFFAFFHPRMPSEPLVFVEVALVSGLAVEISSLLDPEAPLTDAAEADTAVFYSISSMQRGLTGINFGGFLIKQVVDQLKIELPRLRTFATLSPIPGFRAWLEEELVAGRVALRPDQREHLIALAERNNEELPPEDMKTRLLQLCADYLLHAKRADRRALDAVANFHLANGARIERINWLADTSLQGKHTGLTMMVNYIYRLEDIETNHKSYTGDGAIAASSAVEQLARAGSRLRLKGKGDHASASRSLDEP